MRSSNERSVNRPSSSEPNFVVLPRSVRTRASGAEILSRKNPNCCTNSNASSASTLDLIEWMAHGKKSGCEDCGKRVRQMSGHRALSPSGRHDAPDRSPHLSGRVHGITTAKMNRPVAPK